ncbi:MAG TPA: PEP-CTERM sorting domain-containing protein [Tepidisphaeraceae bacterium]|jgi:hypothetical protein
MQWRGLALAGGLSAASTFSAVAAMVPIPVSGFNQDIIVDTGAAAPQNVVTATMDDGTVQTGGLFTGNTWYQVGYNTAAPATGLPAGVVTVSAADPTVTFRLAPANGNNALMLDTTGSGASGSLVLTAPARYTALTVLTSTGNGAGTLIPTLHYSNGAADKTLATITSGDWFGGSPVAYTGSGRVDVSDGSFNSVGTDNPRIYQVNIDLAGQGADQNPISSISFAFTGSDPNTHTAIYGLSGSAVPEPGSVGVLGLLLGAALTRRSRE